jgi:uncharacterized membrane protein AbrB (regulator of aidB expression)
MKTGTESSIWNVVFLIGRWIMSRIVMVITWFTICFSFVRCWVRISIRQLSRLTGFLCCPGRPENP